MITTPQDRTCQHWYSDRQCGRRVIGLDRFEKPACDQHADWDVNGERLCLHMSNGMVRCLLIDGHRGQHSSTPDVRRRGIERRLGIVLAEPGRTCEAPTYFVAGVDGLAPCGAQAIACDLDASDNQPRFFCHTHKPEEGRKSAG